MDKTFLEKLDNSESSRINEFKTQGKQEINPITAFRSKTVQKIVEKGKQTFISGFESSILPSTIPFSERTFVEICPRCACVQSPRRLLPYLEKDLVIPVLNSDYPSYSVDFMDMILRYPHISAYEFYGIRKIALKRIASTVSETEIDSLRKSCIAIAQKNEFARASTVATVIDDFEPFYNSDMPFLLEVYKTIKEKKADNFQKQFDISHLVSALRCSQVFSFIPQVTLDQLDTLSLIPSNNQGVNFDLADVRDTVMNGLNISYNPSIPIETYLDIVSERKSKIQEMVNAVMDKGKADKVTSLIDLQKEIERINEEVRSLEKSNKGKVIDLVTSFAIQNKSSIVAGLVTAASVGLMGFGILGCGAGIASSLGAKALSKKAKISVPQEAGILGQRISTFLEPSYEKMLAATLSTDIQAIQIWRLKKQLSKSTNGPKRR